MKFRELIKEKVLLFDGGMGTLLQAKGLLQKGRAPEELNLTHPDAIREIHRAYVDAGSDIIETNTFGANRIKLSEFKLEGKLKDIIWSAVKNAEQASKGKALIAGSIGPTGMFIEPLGDLTFDDAVGIFKECAEVFLNAGVQLFNLETFMDVKELRAAVVAIRSLSHDVPVIAMMTFQNDMRTVLGTTPEAAGVLLQSLPVDVAGANCSLGPDGIFEALMRMRPYTSKPLIFQPNAGIPVLKGGITVFPAAPEEIAEYVEKAVSLGVRVIAGCCGTTPEHIKVLRERLDSLRVDPSDRVLPPHYTTALSSRTRVSPYGKEVLLIGERLNPSGKKKLQDALKRKDMSLVRSEARRQEEAGAYVLDVNVSVPGVHEPSLMKEVVMAVNSASHLPLSIDSPLVDALKEGVKSVDGKPVLNSATCEEEKFDEVIKTAKLYGAAVIVLPISRGGIPRLAEGRLKLAEWAVRRAEEFGFPVKELFFDPLVLTVSSDSKAPVETLKTLQGYKEKGLFTVMGLSNVSFGLPERRLINRTFFAMAGRFLDAVILDPLDSGLIDTSFSINLLKGADEKAEKYINRFHEGKKDPESDSRKQKEREGPDEALTRAIVLGEKDKAMKYLDVLLDGGTDPLKIANKHIVDALREVGEKFASGEYFLPQVLSSAETVKTVFEKIKPLLLKSSSRIGKKVIFATVEGDVHDIGKNIVITLLEANGFEVIDLGKNVPAEKILNAVENEKPDAVALSALMTTTMVEMKKVIDLLKSRGYHIPVAVGGACVTRDYAKEIGAHIYAEDAMEAVKEFKEFFGLEG